MSLIGVRSKSFRLPTKKKNALRFFNLAMDLGTQSVRNYFDRVVPPSKLQQHLKAHEALLRKLIKKRVLKACHENILFPTNKCVTSKDFDITLLVCLLRNTTQESPPLKGWDELPDESDLSCAADVARLKFYRNEYIAHKAVPELSNAEYQAATDALIGAISRLSKWQLTAKAKEWKDLDVGDEAYREIFKAYVDEHKERKEDRKYLRDLRRYIIDAWRKDDSLFVETKACQYALDQCKRNKYITLSGVSGAGKSAAAYHIALTLENDGYNVLPVTNISEIKKFHDYSEKQIFIFDDPLGLSGLDAVKTEEILQTSAAVDERFTLGDSKIIFTSRQNVINNCDVKNMKSIVQENVIDLHSDGLRLSRDEKLQMFENRTQNLTIQFDPEEILSSEQPNFPLLCKMYSCNKSFQKEGKSFFTDPFSAIIYDLKNYKTMKKHEYNALLLCAFCGGSFEIKAFKQGKYSAQQSLVQSLTDRQYHDIEAAMDCLVGIYLEKEKIDFKFIHESLFEAVIYHIGTDYRDFLFQECPLDFIQRYLLIVNSRKEPFTKPECDCLAKRHMEEIRHGNFLDVFLNPFFEEDEILMSFMKLLDSLKTDELTKVMLETRTQVNQQRIASVRKETIWNRMVALNIFLESEATKAFHWIIALNFSFIFFYILGRLDEFPLRYNNDLRCLNFLHVACFGGNVEILAKLLKTSNPDELNEKYPPVKPSMLHLAVYSKNIEMAKVVIETTSGQLMEVKNCFECTPLFDAVAMGLYGMCHLLIERGSNVHTRAKDEIFPLWMAAHEGHSDIVQLLLTNGANINQTDVDGATPLSMAAERGREDVVRILLENNAEVNLCDKENVSPLFIAAQNGFHDIVKMLLERNTNVDRQENNGESALYIAARNGHKDVVKLLLENKASVNLCDKDHVSPLNIACQYGQTETVRVLLDNHAAVNQLDKQSVSPLYIAAQYGHTKTVQSLIENKADVNLTDKNDVSPLYIACHNEHSATVEVLLCHGANVDHRTNDGATPLYICAYKGNEDILKILLQAKADINIADSNLVSPLYMAAQNGHTNCIKLLLDHGAFVNTVDNEGVSPLFIAVQNNHIESTKLLLNNGGDKNLRDKNGVSPLDYSKRRNFHSLVSDSIAE